MVVSARHGSIDMTESSASGISRTRFLQRLDYDFGPAKWRNVSRHLFCGAAPKRENAEFGLLNVQGQISIGRGSSSVRALASNGGFICRMYGVICPLRLTRGHRTPSPISVHIRRTANRYLKERKPTALMSTNPAIDI